MSFRPARLDPERVVSEDPVPKQLFFRIRSFYRIYASASDLPRLLYLIN